MSSRSRPPADQAHAQACRVHAKRRSGERYGLELNRHDLRHIAGEIQAGRWSSLPYDGRGHKNRSAYEGEVQGKLVRVVYDRLKRVVVTFLPPRAARNEVVATPAANDAPQVDPAPAAPAPPPLPAHVSDVEYLRARIWALEKELASAKVAARLAEERFKAELKEARSPAEVLVAQRDAARTQVATLAAERAGLQRRIAVLERAMTVKALTGKGGVGANAAGALRQLQAAEELTHVRSQRSALMVALHEALKALARGQVEPARQALRKWSGMPTDAESGWTPFEVVTREALEP